MDCLFGIRAIHLYRSSSLSCRLSPGQAASPTQQQNAILQQYGATRYYTNDEKWNSAGYWRQLRMLWYFHLWPMSGSSAVRNPVRDPVHLPLYNRAAFDILEMTLHALVSLREERTIATLLTTFKG